MKTETERHFVLVGWIDRNMTASFTAGPPVLQLFIWLVILRNQIKVASSLDAPPIPHVTVN